MNREDFPLLADGKWAYLDNAATTQRPQPVLDALAEAAVTCNANVHRSPHGLGREMTRRFEEARDKVGRFFGAGENYTVVFTSGATGAINLVAHSYLEAFCQPGDRILTLGSEHHSNFVPWQQLCKRQGLDFQVVPILPSGQPDWAWFRQALSPATKLVALAHVTNTFGVVNPVEEVIRLAHERGIPVLVDGAQAAGHRPVDVERLGCDFYCVSAHKMYGPTGIGALLARTQLLEQMPPLQFGGEMVERVTVEDTRFQPPPYRFEAGTPHFLGAVGFAAAVDHLGQVGLEQAAREEQTLARALWEGLRAIPEVELPVSGPPQAGIVSFTLPPFHPYDVAVLLDQQGVAVRSGTHRAHPLFDALGMPQGVVRASLGLYNTLEDVERLCRALRRVAAIKL